MLSGAPWRMLLGHRPSWCVRLREWGRPMRRQTFLLPLVCVLALATGLALLGASELLAVGPRPGDSRPATDDNVAIVRRFYDAVNAAIGTGDDAFLAEVMAPDVVDRTPGGDGGGGGLARHLATLHAVNPGLALVVDDVLADGDRVTAWVTVAGPASAPFPGLALPAAPAWGVVDRFRVAGGRIVEYWGGHRDADAVRPLLLGLPVESRSAPAVLGLARFTVAPGAAMAEADRLPGPLLIVVERGVLVASIGEADGETELEAGAAVVVPPATAYAVGNGGEAAAVFLSAALLPAGWIAWDNAAEPGEAAWPVAWGEGIAVRPLAGGPTPTLPAGAATVALARLRLLPGTGFLAGGGGTTLLAVEAGTLARVASDGPVRFRRGPGPLAPGRGADLAVGDGALIEPAVAGAFRAVGSGRVEVFVMTVTPVAPHLPGAPSPAPAPSASPPAALRLQGG